MWKQEKAHGETINFLTGLKLSDGNMEELYLATMCAGGTLKLWESWANVDEQNVTNFEQTGEILFGKNLQEAFALTPIGPDSLLLAVGGFDKNIHFYTCEKAKIRANRGEKCQIHDLFNYKLSLTGHMDSIKDLCFTTQKFTMANMNLQYLASCSQDQKIRIWKIQPLKDVREELKQNEGTDADKEAANQDNIEQYQSKTSYVLDLHSSEKEEHLFNVALDSVLIHHQNSVSSVNWAATDSLLRKNSGNKE